jgi:hypothetical protein
MFDDEVRPEFNIAYFSIFDASLQRFNTFGKAASLGVRPVIFAGYTEN